LGSAGVPPLGMGGVADPKKHAPPHVCYLAERGRSALKDKWRKIPKMGSARASPLRTEGVTDPKNKLPPHMYYHVKCGRWSFYVKWCTRK